MGDLEAYGFRINTYDLYIANKMLLTVCCHVDNINISCVDKNEVKKMIQWLDS